MNAANTIELSYSVDDAKLRECSFGGQRLVDEVEDLGVLGVLGVGVITNPCILT